MSWLGIIWDLKPMPVAVRDHASAPHSSAAESVELDATVASDPAHAPVANRYAHRNHRCGHLGHGTRPSGCSREHEVTVFEAAHHIGGHTNTVDVDWQGQHYAIDTGFIVFNDWTYPNFIAMLQELDVAWQPSNMSFSACAANARGLEYNGTSLNSLFAQRRNLLRPSFLRMIADILRFNRESRAAARRRRRQR